MYLSFGKIKEAKGGQKPKEAKGHKPKKAKRKVKEKIKGKRAKRAKISTSSDNSLPIYVFLIRASLKSW